LAATEAEIPLSPPGKCIPLVRGRGEDLVKVDVDNVDGAAFVGWTAVRAGKRLYRATFGYIDFKSASRKAYHK